MADIRVCDVCAADGTFSKGRYRQGYPRCIKIDLCEEHRQWTKVRGLKTQDEFTRAVTDTILANKLTEQYTFLRK